MLRTLVIGLVLLATSCGKDDRTKAGVAVGEVVDASGDVKLQRGDATRTLAKGDRVEGDDTIITGADGSVAIVLFHNEVRWDLLANKRVKVRDSIAWNMPKPGPAGTQPTEQASTSAGRPAERSAVDTVASVEVTTKGGQGGSALPLPTPASTAPRAVAAEILRANAATFSSCLDATTPSVTVVVHVAADHSTKVDVIVDKGTLDKTVRACIVAAVTKLASDDPRFPKSELDVSIDVQNRAHVD